MQSWLHAYFYALQTFPMLGVTTVVFTRPARTQRPNLVAEQMVTVGILVDAPVAMRRTTVAAQLTQRTKRDALAS